MHNLFEPTGHIEPTPLGDKARKHVPTTRPGDGRARTVARRDAARSEDERTAVASYVGGWIRVDKDKYGIAAGSVVRICGESNAGFQWKLQCDGAVRNVPKKHQDRFWRRVEAPGAPPPAKLLSARVVRAAADAARAKARAKARARRR